MTRLALSSSVSSSVVHTATPAVAPAGRGMFELPAMASRPIPGPAAASTRGGMVGSAIAIPGRMLRTLTLMRSDQQRSDKEQIRLLKEIDEKPVGGGGAGAGGGMIGNLLGMIPGAGKLAGAGGLLKGAAGGLLKRLPLIGALAGAAGVAGSLMGEDDPSKTPEQNAKDRAERAGSAAGGLAGGLAGASSGAALGSLAGPVGTVVGGVVGGVVGSMGGEKIGEKLGGSIQEGLKTSGLGDKIRDGGQRIGDAARDTATAARRNVAIGAANVADVAAKAPEPVKDAARTVIDSAAAVTPSPIRSAGRAVARAARDLVAEGNWEKQKGNIVDAAQKAGVDPAVMARISNFESKFNADAAPIAKDATKNRVRLFDGRMGISSAHGLGQFTDASWQDVVNKYGGKYGVSGAGTRGGPAGNLSSDEVKKYRSDPKIQAAMLAEFTRDNIEMGRKYGGNNDDANVYALHNLGLGDGKRLLNAVSSSPNISVRDALIGGRDISDKERKRIESVISGNESLYGNGSISVSEAYGRMGRKMAEGDVYAADATRMAGGVATPATPAQADAKTLQKTGTRQDAIAMAPKAPVSSPQQSARAAKSQPAPADPVKVADGQDTGVASPTQRDDGQRKSAQVTAKPAIPSMLAAANIPAVSSSDATNAPSSAGNTARIPSLASPRNASSIPLPGPSTIPEPPNVTVPPPTLNGGSKTPSSIEIMSRQPVGQDVSDRSIAHITSGGLGKV